MSLAARFTLRRGALELDVDLAVASGESVALVGPNGAGKSTCLAVLAGLLRVDRGRLALDGAVLDGGPDGPFVPPERRGVGLVPQGGLLFPHLSALENVAFGPRARGVPRGRARAVAREWLERVGALDRADAVPSTLSGGEAQRVALARALACEPRLLLLDEPLTAVDATGRATLRRELSRHLAAFRGPRVVVVHEIEDALALADRLVVLEEGRVVQSGTVAELARRPRTRFVGDLLGTNAFGGVGRGGVIEVGEGRLVPATAVEGPVTVAVHPRAVSLFPARPAGSPRNVWRTTVLALEPALDRVRVQLAGPVPLVAEVTHGAVAELELREGALVYVAVKATELVVTPA